MRVPDKSYGGYVKHLVTIVLKLPVSDKMRSSFLQQVKDYLDAADPVQGAPQLNAPWTPGNARAGYQTDIPGLISEILAQYALSRVYGEDAIFVAQDQFTQVDRAIDLFINTANLWTDAQKECAMQCAWKGGSPCTSLECPRRDPTWLGNPLAANIGGQSKTICFDGSKLHINPLWGAGEANWIILTDIDDHETFVVPIAFIRDNVNKTVQHRDLKRASVHYFNLHKVY